MIKQQAAGVSMRPGRGLAAACALSVLSTAIGGCAHIDNGAARASAPPVTSIESPSRARSTLGDEPVTGSLLPRRNAATAFPLTIINAESERQRGVTSAAELLSNYPQ